MDATDGGHSALRWMTTPGDGGRETLGRTDVGWQGTYASTRRQRRAVTQRPADPPTWSGARGLWRWCTHGGVVSGLLRVWSLWSLSPPGQTFKAAGLAPISRLSCLPASRTYVTRAACSRLRRAGSSTCTAAHADRHSAHVTGTGALSSVWPPRSVPPSHRYRRFAPVQPRLYECPAVSVLTITAAKPVETVTPST